MIKMTYEKINICFMISSYLDPLDKLTVLKFLVGLIYVQRQNHTKFLFLL